MGSSSSRRAAEASVSQEKFVVAVDFVAQRGMADEVEEQSATVPVPPVLPPLKIPGTKPFTTSVEKNGPSKGQRREILLKFKRQHRSSFVYLSECEKIVCALCSHKDANELASKAAFSQADHLADFSVKVAGLKEHLKVVLSYLIEVGVPALLVESVQTLKENHPDALSYDREPNQQQKGSVHMETKVAQDVMSSLSNAALNFTDSHDEFCEVCAANGMVDLYVNLVKAMADCIPDMLQFEAGGIDMIDQYTERGKFLFCVLGVLHNLAKRPLNKKVFNKCSVMPVLLPLIKVPVMMFAVEALLTLVYLVNDKNNDMLLADQEPLRMIINMLEKARKSADHRYLGFTATEIASGLSHLAYNGENSRMIGQHGGIPLLISMIRESRSKEETQAATKALYTLVFDEANRNCVCNDQDIMETVQLLQSSDDEDIRRPACGILWEVKGKTVADQQAGLPMPNQSTVKDAQRPIAQDGDADVICPKHIMISYQWDYQAIMVQVKENLQRMGFEVWLDLDEMGGSILEAMARAVEDASVVLLGVSQKYQNSPNCRSEAEYAYQRHKAIIPMMMETDYQPDGWLGIIMGTKLWMDFRQDIQSGISQLKKELTQHVAGHEVVQAVMVEEGQDDPIQVDHKLSTWTSDDVARWFEGMGLPVKGNEVRQRLDGPLLIQLYRLKRESPEFFYHSIKADLGLPSIIEVLQFTEELCKLVG